MTDELDVMITKTLEAPLDFVWKIATDAWFLEDRYINHVVIGLNDRLTILSQTPEWKQVVESGQNVHTFMQLMESLASALPDVDIV